MNPEIKEKLQEFYESPAAQMTIKELLTTTSNIALPTMVQAAALLELGIWVDARELAMKAPVPTGAGKTVDTQILTGVDYDNLTEGQAFNPADPTPTKRTITLAPFGKATLISDLLANTSAINFVQQVGKVHGGAVRKGILDKIVDAMEAVAGNSKNCASGTTLTFTEVADAIKLNGDDGAISDFVITTPASMWTAFTSSYAVQQFSGALAQLLAEGKLPKALGLEWYADPYFATATTTAVAIVGTKGESAIWAALQDEPVVELYREPLKLANTIVTHMDGGAAGGIAGGVCKIVAAT